MHGMFNESNLGHISWQGINLPKGTEEQLWQAARWAQLWLYRLLC